MLTIYCCLETIDKIETVASANRFSQRIQWNVVRTVIIDSGIRLRDGSASHKATSVTAKALTANVCI